MLQCGFIDGVPLAEETSARPWSAVCTPEWTGGQRSTCGDDFQPGCANRTKYDYDAIGNLTFKDGVGSYTYVPGRPHLLATAGADVYFHDSAGNQTERPNETVKYTTFRKIREITRLGQRIGFEYDAFGIPIKKSGDGGETVYVNGVYEITNPGLPGAVHRYHVSNGSAVVATLSRWLENNHKEESLQYYHRDAMGSVDVITDKNGSAEYQYYDAWGLRLQGSWGGQAQTAASPKTSFGFTGHQHDQDFGKVNLVNMIGRHYDPKLGRFLVADSSAADPLHSQALNRYSYVYNSPTNFTDPTGYEAEGGTWHEPDSFSVTEEYLGSGGTWDTGSPSNERFSRADVGLAELVTPGMPTASGPARGPAPASDSAFASNLAAAMNSVNSGCCGYFTSQPRLNPRFWFKEPGKLEFYSLTGPNSGNRPSQAIEAVFMPRATQLECASIVAAAVYMALLRTLQAPAFDARFTMMVIVNVGIPIVREAFKPARVSSRSQLRVGDLVYFDNVPGVKGFWKGFNAVVVKAGSDPRYTGLGYTSVTEGGILAGLHKEAVAQGRLPVASTPEVLVRSGHGLLLGDTRRPTLEKFLKPVPSIGNQLRRAAGLSE
jgi:RHS repeat-associated protein